MELIRTSLPYFKPTHRLISAFTESTDAIVPDTAPDIGRILCAYASVTIKDELPQNDRILLSGVINATVLYRPDGQDTTRFLHVPMSFAHIEETPGIIPEHPCFVRCQAAQVTAKTVNSRKVNITAVVSLEVSVFAAEEAVLTQEIDCQGDALEVLYQTQTVSTLQCVMTREFTILDDIELAGTDGMQLICAHGIMRPATARPGGEQLALSGELELSLLLMDDTGTLQPLTQTIGYSQVLEAPGLRSDLSLDVRLALRNLDCMLREDGVLSIGAGVRALLLQQEEREVQTVRDLYHRNSELSVETQPVELYVYHGGAPFQIESVTMTSSLRPVSEVVQANGVCTAITAGDQGVLQAQIQVSVLYRDHAGALCAESYPITVALSSVSLDADHTPQDICAQIAATPSGDNNLQLRVGLTGNLITQSLVTLQDITALATDRPRDLNDLRDITLILRYIQKPVALWDLAKQYASTMQAIRQANTLPDQTETVADTMLLIPVCTQ